MKPFRRFLFVLIAAVCLTHSALAQPIEFEHANLSFYRDESGNKQRIKTKDDWQLRRQQILSGAQLAMGEFPKNRLSEKMNAVEVSRYKLTESIVVKTIRITVTRTSHVVFDLYVPNHHTEAKLAAVLALHPTGSPGKRIIGGLTPRSNRQYANELAKRGYVVIAPDYPSFGDLQDHDFNQDGLSSGTMQGIVNHMRCVDYLETLEFVDKERMGVIGHSLGGHNAIFVALFDPRLKAIATSCGWTPFHDYYEGKIAGWTSDRYMPLLKSKYQLAPDDVPFDFYELIAALAPRPFYSNSPQHDANFSIEGVKKAIPKIKQVYSLFDATKNVQVAHPKCAHDFPSEIRAESYRFLDKALGHTPQSDIGFGGELPRIRPLEPAEAIKSFDNAELSLVACEPVVHDPIAMSFDEHQRLFVIEMKDYSEQDKESLGRVRMLVDNDQDGIYESSTIYADDLSWPTAIICYDGGVFVGAAPDIWFLKDTNDDGKADERTKIFTGFGRGNVQGLMNCFRWGLDNRIHGATSSSGGNVYRIGRDPKTAISLRGADFSFDPRKLDLKRETGGAQHGMCFDDFGNKYVCSNSDHAQAILFDDRYLARNSYFRGLRARMSIAADGGQAPVFRKSPVEPWRTVRTRLRVAGRVPGPVEGGGTAAGYFTGSTGITIYRGDADAVEKGTAIIGDVGSNIVHRKQIKRNGLDITATRIDERSELIGSKDIWFRPVQFGNAPDGTLYILDMYREVIEHPKSLPPVIKRHLDLTSGRNRGRIYRLGRPQKRPVDLEPDMASIDLVEFLDHENSWHRETAARLIYQKQDPRCVPALQTVRVQGFSPLGRMHALYALFGLNRLTLDDLVIATRDSDANVRRHVILLAEKSNPNWLFEPAIRNLESDPNVHVKMQLAFSIGETKSDKRVDVLWRIMRKSTDHPLMMTAIMSSADGVQARLLGKLLDSGAFLDSSVGQSNLQSLIEQLVKRFHPNDIETITKLFTEMRESGKNADVMRIITLLSGSNSAFKSLYENHSKLQQFVSAELDKARLIAGDSTRPTADRIAAIRQLRLGNLKEDKDSLLQLISIEQPVEVQVEAVQSLATIADDETALKLFQSRRKYGRETAKAIGDVVFSRINWSVNILKTAKPTDIEPYRLQLLTKSHHGTIRELAKELLSKRESPHVKDLLARYKASLSAFGDPENGKKVFTKNCSQCHKAGGLGVEIGPNLAAMRARGKEAILVNVLDPNREVNPQFVNYIIQTRDGRSFTGMLVSESPSLITLKREQNKLIEIEKSEIEKAVNTGLSLMPVGIEKEISVEQMADLLEFLMNAR